ncbi:MULTISPECIES: STAS domain-containing protein [Rossellomorea]|jgi:rsbT co-antagonist protein RsbR|uniref:STAS domain-containing protein n=1 Tax=Rossellomorea TaxID=2837508 RepID=UPI0011E922F0|nr:MULTISPECIES: STAS domain-containing protein [Rossellomorea]MDT9027376.1 STAS domain-containing protein [Rossellomorea sp. YC4-1]TYS91459.1 STAS domain-containing protein [Rossellomorea aquimaris]
MSMKAIHDENKYLEFINNIVDAKTKLIQGRTNGDAPYPNIVNVSLRKWREEMIELLAQSLRTPNSNTISRWACSSVTLFRQLDLSLEVAIEDLRYFRDEIGNMIKTDSIKIELSIDTFYELLSLFHSGVDRAIYRLTMAHSHPHSETISSELSIPIVKVTDTIAILPLIGDINSARAKDLMERSLSQGSALGLSYLIIDLSGVTVVDTMVADQLFKVVAALKLAGIQVVLTGIRPEIAQTMVNLGIVIKHIPTFASLHTALIQLQKQKSILRN